MAVTSPSRWPCRGSTPAGARRSGFTTRSMRRSLPSCRRAVSRRACPRGAHERGDRGVIGWIRIRGLRGLGPRGPRRKVHSSVSTGGQSGMWSCRCRMVGAVLQHGSLLLAANRFVPEESRHPGLEELQRRGECGGSWAWGSPAGTGLVRGWLTRLAATLGEGLETPVGRFVPSPEAGYEEGLTRFQQDSWNARR